MISASAIRLHKACLPKPANRLAARFQAWRAERRERGRRRDRLRHLLQLGDHLLDDIGLDRHTLEVSSAPLSARAWEERRAALSL
ncbi:hypothetical protein Sa4125_36190 [Aureimonas sp. SA4125]|uniref:hypothetical protein n=1 Tax=Aureimonas sp. SA4125 TaxID=2826993 RepID=UPI001CC5FE0D|nr:hypothetical protein [Aureimonas sp. SA4125]BDA86077.1 hypothetical protein Sa4125_36190 [Aureimonas sp. SA4125]